MLADVLGRVRPELIARYPHMTERTKGLEAFVERSWWRFLAGPPRDDVVIDIERAVREELLCTSV